MDITLYYVSTYACYHFDCIFTVAHVFHKLVSSVHNTQSCQSELVNFWFYFEEMYSYFNLQSYLWIFSDDVFVVHVIETINLLLATTVMCACLGLYTPYDII